MTKREAKLWLEDEYPLTIISDRYTGCYSGGNYLAFPEYYHQLSVEMDEDDVTCMMFWDKFRGIVGKGYTAEEALDNLRIEMVKLAEQ